MDPRDTRAEIVAANSRFMQLFNSGDIEGVSRCYTQDAQFLVPNQEPFQGRAAIAGALGGLRGDGNTLQIDTDEVAGSGFYVWETGRYIVKTAAGQLADRGKYVVVWRRDDDETWRLHRDIINTSQPA